MKSLARKIADLYRLLNNLIRIGTIVEVDHQAARARVKTGGNTTGWQKWVTLRAGTTTEWNPPTVGEQVVLLSPGGDLAQAVILVGLFTSNAPSSSKDEHRRVYPDGATINYDHVKKELVANLPGKANVNITGDATVNVGGNATTAVGGICKVNAEMIHHNDGNPVVTTAHICHLTGKPHGDGSSTVTAGK
ncbi:phage baseplate assembly protein V [Marinobacter oulmenensis]|uniref:Phage baseplate assembly protein V n=1 Tax=Marinobacter oulmenensis TaxID=643747 RepID=A0A840UB33_9GAMM|nr:phage baseplate assembly protein V [Marinobacter oulmenensis]MBB5320470.1 phage baseplate assembly protein V [Marinobacter oulmenensis]